MTTPTMTVTTGQPAPAQAAAAPAAPAPAAPAAEGTAPAAAPAPATPVATSIEEPAAAPAAAPAPAAEPAPADEGGPIEYESTGDPGMDLALGFLGKLGIGPQDPAMLAAEQGNFALLKAKLALMGDKATGWEQIVALGEQQAKVLAEGKAAAAKATEDAILSAFGDDREAAAKQWANVKEWAKANAEPAERAAVNAALAAGGIAAKAMAAYLGWLYSKHPSAVVEPTVVTKIGGNSGNNSGALSPAEYRTEVATLRSKLGQGMDGSQEYAALVARRMAWRG